MGAACPDATGPGGEDRCPCTIGVQGRAALQGFALRADEIDALRKSFKQYSMMG
jgi:hypothetical protein